MKVFGVGLTTDDAVKRRLWLKDMIRNDEKMVVKIVKMVVQRCSVVLRIMTGTGGVTQNGTPCLEERATRNAGVDSAQPASCRMTAIAVIGRLDGSPN